MKVVTTLQCLSLFNLIWVAVTTTLQRLKIVSLIKVVAGTSQRRLKSVRLFSTYEQCLKWLALFSNEVVRLYDISKASDTSVSFTYQLQRQYQGRAKLRKCFCGNDEVKTRRAPSQRNLWSKFSPLYVLLTEHYLCFLKGFYCNDLHGSNIKRFE